MKHCDDCGVDTWEPGDPLPEGAIGVPLVLPGQRHKATCPLVPRLSEEQRRELLDRLAEMDRIRRRGAAEAMNMWIG